MGTHIFIVAQLGDLCFNQAMLKSSKQRDAGVILAIHAAGSAKRLAELLNISASAVSAWRSVPTSRVLAIESATGVHRSHLRSDLFGADDPAMRVLRQIHWLMVSALPSAALPASELAASKSPEEG